MFCSVEEKSRKLNGKVDFHLFLGIGYVEHNTIQLLTSMPFCCALQLLMFKEPLMKSFCTSTIKKALIGRTICVEGTVKDMVK